MPHAIAVDDAAAGRLGDRQHAAVDVVGHARDHVFRSPPQAPRPIPPHQRVIGADAARRNNDCLRFELKGAEDIARTLAAALDIAWLKDIAAHAVDHRTRSRDLIDAVPELERDESSFLAFSHARDERLEHTRPRSPGEMKARHRIAVTGGAATAALRPADHRKKA